jgi:hypothetical protein
MFLVEMLLKFAASLIKGIWRVVSIKRDAPEEKHRPVDYVDALLFGGEDAKSSDTSHFPTILDKH